MNATPPQQQSAKAGAICKRWCDEMRSDSPSQTCARIHTHTHTTNTHVHKRVFVGSGGVMFSNYDCCMVEPFDFWCRACVAQLFLNSVSNSICDKSIYTYTHSTAEKMLFNTSRNMCFWVCFANAFLFDVSMPNFCYIRVGDCQKLDVSLLFAGHNASRAKRSQSVTAIAQPAPNTRQTERNALYAAIRGVDVARC